MAERNRQEQRAIRERMSITGENYTTALRHIRSEKANSGDVVPEEQAEENKQGGEKTGRWELIDNEWHRIW